MYDYLIVGAGIAGAVIARKLTDAGKKCLVLERKPVTGGTIRTEKMAGIDCHIHGAHVYRTDDEETWQFLNKYVSFNNFINSPLANYKGRIFNLPFNMNTFNALWKMETPDKARIMVESQRTHYVNPKNLEQHCLNMVGRDIYEMFIKGYTEKQWGRPCTELEPATIRRIKLRFTYNNNYYDAKYQGVTDYNKLIEKLLEGSKVILNTGYDVSNIEYRSQAKKVIYTGALDEYYQYCFGKLEYRSLRFEHQELNMPDYQGNAVVNYTDRKVPYTRIIEHKHFMRVDTPTTVISKEYPAEWVEGMEKYYPINDEKNEALYKKYRAKADEEGLIIVGKLAEYQYWDMDETVRSALNKAEEVLHG